MDAARGARSASIGVHVNRGVTTHGFAINVNNDLQPFEWIVPCGIESCRMTSLARELGAEQDLGAFATTVRDRFGDVYGRAPVEIGVGELIERVPELRVLAEPGGGATVGAVTPAATTEPSARGPTPAARGSPRGGRSASESPPG